MDVVLGFDPGGGGPRGSAGQFGWAVVECVQHAPRVRTTGLARHAAEAVGSARAALRDGDRVVGAGIDSPLYWTPSGERESDLRVREMIRQHGAGSTAGGTVQHPNCLQGSCVVQGPTAALLLRQAFPQLPLTESHPKALLWALRIATQERRPSAVAAPELALYLEGAIGTTEHERDAVLGGYAAWCMHTEAPGWADLVAMEQRPLFFTAEPVSYWFPSATTLSA